MTKITFVCTGNICRSSLAEGIIRHLSSKIIASSSGIEKYHAGEKPDYRALEVAKENGVDMQGLFAKQITMQDIIENDYIFAVTHKHKNKILKHCPEEFAHKVHNLLEFCKIENKWNNDIIDPYYGTKKDFQEVYDLISQSCKRLVEIL
jgi:protein-tyrosine phosphatase